MFRALASLFLLTHCALAANNPIREVTSQATRAANQLVPAFYKGYIYWVGREGNNHSVSIYAPDGHLAFGFDTPSGPVLSIAVDTDGNVAVAWGSWRLNGGGIDFRDSSGALLRTIQTGRYLPAHISFAEDHSLWSLGCQLDATLAAHPDRQDYMTVRRYLPDGKEAGAYLPRSLFPPGVMEPGDVGWQRSGSITVAHDRVGLWVYSGTNDDNSEWVELDLKGNLLGRWRLDQFARDQRMAFTTDGHLFVQNFDDEAKALRLHTLDRDSSSWRPIETPPTGRLEGAEGDALLFSDAAKGPMHVRWYQHP